MNLQNYVVVVTNDAAMEGNEEYIKHLRYSHLEKKIEFATTEFINEAEKLNIGTAEAIYNFFLLNPQGSFRIVRLQSIH